MKEFSAVLRRPLSSVLLRTKNRLVSLSPQPSLVACPSATTWSSSSSLRDGWHRQSIRPYSRSVHHSKKEVLDEKYSKYLYPLAEEPPLISETLASSVTEDDHAKPTASTTKTKEGEKDPMDRTNMSSYEVGQIRNAQKLILNKKLSPSVTAIHDPPSIPFKPKESKTSNLDVEISRLDNGIRVVSQESASPNPASTVGVVSKLGNRHEVHPKERGMCNVLELLSFRSSTPSYPDPMSFLATDLGGAAHLTAMGREQSLHFIDLLRPHVTQAFSLLQEVLLEPQWTEEHIASATQALEYQFEECPLEAILAEALQQAAFGRHQQLGQPHMLMAKNPELTVDAVKDFWTRHFINNPQNMVFSGVGIGHDEFVELTNKHFGRLKQIDKNATQNIPSIYRGGQVLIERKAKEDDFVRLALVLKVDGWHSDDLATICVLQTLLGGGSSFSAGGPGKGMYSRLYREVLNKESWAESAEAFTVFYEEVGLFGLSGSVKPKYVRDMVKKFAKHLVRLRDEPVDAVELERARNMLRGLILSQLESRLVLCEDMGRQVLTYDKHENIRQTCARLEKVTAEDIQDMATRALAAGHPSSAAVGPDVKSFPTHDEIVGYLEGS